MKISDLPPGLRELAEQRREEYPESYVYPGLSPDHIYNQIIYDDTPEGFEFWNRIEEGDFTPYYNCRVVNLKLKKS